MAATPDVAVVDYGAGNLRSVAKALECSGARVRITGEASAVARADAVVLPGAGAFADAMASLKAAGLDRAVRDSVAAGTPYLGLCVGLQLLFEEGDEHGPTAGLGVLPGRVERFPERDAEGGLLRVPHMGWNEVHFSGHHPVLEGLPERDIFYFVHGFRAVPVRDDDTIGRTGYGGEFAAAVACENVFAVQFHPEKSQASGRRLLDRFVTWVGSCD